MALEFFGPRWFYKGSFSPDDQDEATDVLGNFIDDDENFSQPEGWTCEILSSFNTRQPHMWKKFYAILDPYLGEFFEQIGTKCPVYPHYQEAWVNKYRKGFYQEYHTHDDPKMNLSIVYYHRMEEGSNNFNFYGDDHNNYRKGGLDQLLNVPSYQAYTPHISQGDFIIFPSFYAHFVTPIKTDFERVSVAVNINLKRS